MISTELLKGTLRSIVLKVLKEKEKMYGYEITQHVEQLSAGNIQLTYGALYPVLHKLESDGMVTTTSEIVNNRNRIYYSLTKSGSQLAVEKIKELEDFIQIMQGLIKPGLSI